MSQIKINPYDLLSGGFVEEPQLSLIRMDQIRYNDLIRAYSKDIKDRKTGKTLFTLYVEHRCSNNSMSNFHCFDFYMREDNIKLSRRVLPHLHNNPLNHTVSYFMSEFYRRSNFDKRSRR